VTRRADRSRLIRFGGLKRRSPRSGVRAGASLSFAWVRDYVRVLPPGRNNRLKLQKLDKPRSRDEAEQEVAARVFMVVDLVLGE
jgi:hypothetical protein